MHHFHKQSSLEPIDASKMWGQLLDAIRKTVTPQSVNAADLFLNMPVGYGAEDFGDWAQTVSSDVSKNLEYALEGKASELYVKLMGALRDGNYTSQRPANWDPRYRKQLLREVYSEAWNEAMMQAWAKIESNPKELARLQAMR